VWTLHKYADDAAFKQGKHFAKEVIEGNLLLNEGIGALLNLLIGAGATAFDNLASYIGVGDSNTAAAATQTGLIGTATYVGMEAGYPQVSGQTVTFRAVFDGDTGNHAWQEFTVASGNSNAAVNLNRRVSDQGTKASGQTWTIDLSITFS
jgi:hypothetical protein